MADVRLLRPYAIQYEKEWLWNWIEAKTFLHLFQANRGMLFCPFQALQYGKERF